MFDHLISRFRIWHFGHVCRRDPGRIGLELRRMLAELRGPARWAHAQHLMRSGHVCAYPLALGAVAEVRWKITDSAEIARIFESLTEEEKDRILSALNFILPQRLG
jgi:hypothetical protein